MKCLSSLRIMMSSCLLVVITEAALGNNNLFLPGDAFFPTVLTVDVVNRLKADPNDPFLFTYSSFDGYASAFCGYAGYNRAKISGLDEAFVSHLKKAYADIRERDEERRLIEHKENGKTTLIETNGIRVLFYQQTFQFPQYRIGLRYNEKWADETVKFGHQREHIRLCSLIPHENAIMESWRDATVVEGLNVSLPDVKLQPVPVADDPITINGNVKAIVLTSAPLLDYFFPQDFDTPTVRIVDSSGITKMHYEDGEWISEKDTN